MKRKTRISLGLFLGILVSFNGNALMAETAAAGTLTREQKEDFLRKARIVRSREISSGITRPRRATLSNGKLTHDAQIQKVDIRKPIFQTLSGTEIGFTDSYKYNIAAYRLDKILGLEMIPVSVERKVQGTPTAVTWWVDDVLMTEKDRFVKHHPVPDMERRNRQIYCVRVFDQLIYNTDRNLGNLLITKDWKLWMIDHTRAFRRNKRLKSGKDLVRCDRRLLSALRKLDYETLWAELYPLLTKSQIKALLVRRDRTVEIFDQKIAELGEDAVLFNLHELRPSTNRIPVDGENRAD